MTSGFHYVKGSTRGYYPARIVSVYVEPNELGRYASDNSRIDTEFGKVFVSWTCRRNRVYSKPSSAVCGSIPAFWELLERGGRQKSRSLVIAPVAGDSLTLLRLWSLLSSRGCVFANLNRKKNQPQPHQPQSPAYTIRRLTLRSKPDIIDYTLDGHSYLWLSGVQFFDMSPRELATATDYQMDKPPDAGAGESGDYWSPRERCRLWLHAFIKLAEFWADLKAGPFPRTIPAGAAAFMNSRVTPKTLCKHGIKPVCKLEREACHGGRASVWCYKHFSPHGKRDNPADLPFEPSGYGAERGPLWHYDFSSMYPNIMAKEAFPLKYLWSRHDATLSDLSELLRNFCCIARVAIDTKLAEYPLRMEGNSVYPVGRFTTTLATPELLSALSMGHIVKVHEIAVYTMGYPYVRAATELIELRKKYHDTGNKGFERFIKQMAVSMTGRLAMRSGEWVPMRDLHAGDKWGEEYVDDPKLGPPTRHRYRAGLVERLVKDDGGTGTLTAGYAHITAYGRLRLRALREALPPFSVIQQGIDGLWVNAHGAVAIESLRLAGSPLVDGLRDDDKGQWVRFYSPTHYCVDGQWTVAGLREPSFLWGSSSYTDRATLNPVRSGVDHPPFIVTDVVRKGILKAEKKWAIVGRNGWATPMRVPILPTGLPRLPDEPKQETLF